MEIHFQNSMFFRVCKINVNELCYIMLGKNVYENVYVSVYENVNEVFMKIIVLYNIDSII